jgi:hypothetical protein
MVNKEVIVSFIMNGNNLIQTETGFVQIQEMGIVTSVENIDFFVNVFVKSSVIKVKLNWVMQTVNNHINRLCKIHFDTHMNSYIRNYNIFCDDGTKEVTIKRTVVYKSGW